VNERYLVSIADGLTKIGFTLSSTAWLDSYDKIYQKNVRYRKKALKTKSLRAKILP